MRSPRAIERAFQFGRRREYVADRAAAARAEASIPREASRRRPPNGCAPGFASVEAIEREAAGPVLSLWQLMQYLVMTACDTEGADGVSRRLRAQTRRR